MVSKKDRGLTRSQEMNGASTQTCQMFHYSRFLQSKNNVSHLSEAITIERIRIWTIGKRLTSFWESAFYQSVVAGIPVFRPLSDQTLKHWACYLDRKLVRKWNNCSRSSCKTLIIWLIIRFSISLRGQVDLTISALYDTGAIQKHCERGLVVQDCLKGAFDYFWPPGGSGPS